MSNYWDDIENESVRQSVQNAEEYIEKVNKEIEFGLNLYMFKNQDNKDRLNYVSMKLEEFIKSELQDSYEDLNIFALALKQASVNLVRMGAEKIYEEHLEK